MFGDLKKQTVIQFCLFKTTELNGSGYIKVPIRCSAMKMIKNDDKFCNFWSILAYLHPVAD